MAYRRAICRHCDLEIEGESPYRKGTWLDRGGDSICNDGAHKHAPIKG